MPFNARPLDRPSVRPHHRYTNVNDSINRYGNLNATRGYFGGKRHSHPRLVKQRQLKSQSRRKRKAEIVSVSVSSCPQIWNIELEKDREKEKLGGRPAKLNEKKGNRDLEREIKNKRKLIFLLEKQHENFLAAVRKWKILAATNIKWKWAGAQKKLNENTLLSLLRRFFR